MSLQYLTIQHWLKRHARYRPDHIAFIYGDERLTFGELYKEVTQLSNAFLANGIKKGDKVATILSNSKELYQTYWACAAMGAVCVPVSPLMRGEGLKNLLENSDTKLVITCVEFADNFISDTIKIDKSNCWVTNAESSKAYQSYHDKKKESLGVNFSIEDIKGGEPYNIIYSSGTTGTPKGIVISHAVRALYGSLFANFYRMTPESVVLHSGAIIFNGSFLTLMPAMFLGCTYILHDHFDAEMVIETIKKEKVTHTILVPSQIIGCLQHKDFTGEKLSSLEYILSVGAPLLQEHKEKIEKQLPGIFYELYGLTEGFMTILDKNDFKKKTGSVGIPPPFMEMKIVDAENNELPTGEIGEIIGKGPMLMTEYYKDPLQTKAALQYGWLYTGDLGYVDADGFLFLTGRKKDMIISGGVNVYPSDIEEVIIRHPVVKDVAVFGVPHKDWGETPVAAIVLKEGQKILTANEIKNWINDHLGARYQKVSDVLFINELPRNVAGKILKRELKENYVNQIHK